MSCIYVCNLMAMAEHIALGQDELPRLRTSYASGATCGS
jgi:hypothetical protein